MSPDLDPTTDLPSPDHTTPAGVSDETVEAVGVLTKALETCDRARGNLLAFHQLMGETDELIGEAMDALRAAGHEAEAERLSAEVRGRNAVAGRWTFQLVEEFDDGYWTTLRGAEQDVRNALVAGRRHLHEARLKEDERTHGRRGHEATPQDVGEDPPRD